MKLNVRYILGTVLCCLLYVYIFRKSIVFKLFDNDVGFSSFVQAAKKTFPLLESDKLPDFLLKTTREDKYNWTYSDELKQFAPALNDKEYVWYMELILEFKRRCQLVDISYFVFARSAFGVYRHHGFIPWNSDFDVHVNSSQKQSLNSTLSRVHGYGLYTNDNYQWKFWSQTKSIRTPHIWNWPYIDIFFFGENGTHVYDVTWKTPREPYPRSIILPLGIGPFENMVVPVPCNLQAYLNKKYGMQNQQCYSGRWDHKRENFPVYPPLTVPCRKLHNMYAFVHHFKIEDVSYEELRLGNKTLYRLQGSSNGGGD